MPSCPSARSLHSVCPHSRRLRAFVTLLSHRLLEFYLCRQAPLVGPDRGLVSCLPSVSTHNDCFCLARHVFPALSNHLSVEELIAANYMYMSHAGQPISAAVPSLSAASRFRSLKFVDLKPEQLTDQDVDLWVLALPNEV